MPEHWNSPMDQYEVGGWIFIIGVVVFLILFSWAWRRGGRP